ncbi:MAG: 2-amino-4-hydroxy-6-hydroxymethyldihydropteridine diphosphokinase [Gemmataceae bacterium]
MPLAYIALGSNLGNRWENLSSAERRLRAEPGLRVIATSEFYETAPLDCPPGSGDFLNAVVAVETDRSPEDLPGCSIASNTNSAVRSERNAPRTLDLDLLLYGDRVIDTPQLVVPHPRMHERDCTGAPCRDRSMLFTPHSARR